MLSEAALNYHKNSLKLYRRGLTYLITKKLLTETGVGFTLIALFFQSQIVSPITFETPFLANALSTEGH